MPRKKCPRIISTEPRAYYFKPAGIPMRDLDEVELGLDELEAVRLADFDGLFQEDAALAMGISRQTFGRIIHEAHRKIASALIMGKALRIDIKNSSDPGVDARG
jgi:uncharacterized protein